MGGQRAARLGVAGQHVQHACGLIRHERLEAVRRDLADPLLSGRSVAALAARWCFFDAAHFSRVFRQHYGYPPSRARSAGLS